MHRANAPNPDRRQIAASPPPLRSGCRPDRICPRVGSKRTGAVGAGSARDPGELRWRAGLLDAVGVGVQRRFDVGRVPDNFRDVGDHNREPHLRGAVRRRSDSQRCLTGPRTSLPRRAQSVSTRGAGPWGRLRAEAAWPRLADLLRRTAAWDERSARCRWHWSGVATAAHVPPRRAASPDHRSIGPPRRLRCLSRRARSCDKRRRDDRNAGHALWI